MKTWAYINFKYKEFTCMKFETKHATSVEIHCTACDKVNNKEEFYINCHH